MIDGCFFYGTRSKKGHTATDTRVKAFSAKVKKTVKREPLPDLGITVRQKNLKIDKVKRN